MQDYQNIQELSDQELEAVVGGQYHISMTNAQVSVQAAATGGQLNLDTVYAKTKSVSITDRGESASVAVGVAIAIAV